MATNTYKGSVVDTTYGIQPYLTIAETQGATQYTYKIDFGVIPTKKAFPAGVTAKGRLTGNLEWKTYSKTTEATVVVDTPFRVGTITITRDRYVDSSREFEVTWDAGLVGGTATGEDQLVTPATHTYTIPKLASYTVTFKKDNATSAAIFTTQQKIYGRTLTLTTSKPTKANYNFASWNTNTSGTGTNYASGGSYTANAAVTLYPRWTPVTYAVTYNANGGSGAPAKQTKIYGTTLKLSSAIPTRSGYTFVRWNTNSSGTGTNYNAGANYTANAAVNLYAVWQINYTPPQINNLTAYRTDTDGNKDDEGTSFRVDFTWVAGTDSSESGSVTLTNATIKWKKTTESSYSDPFTRAITSTNVSIGVGTNAALDTDAQYNVQVTLTPSNSHPDIVRMTYVSTSSFIIDINTEGNAIGIGMAAPDDVNENQLWIDANMYLKKDLLLEKTDPKLRVRSFDANNAVVADGQLSASTSGNFGLYDQKHNKWLIRSDSSSRMVFGMPMYIQTIHNTKHTAPSTQNSYTYSSAISELANYNIVLVHCSCGNCRQLLIFCRSLGNAEQYISDNNGTYVRGGYIVDWTNKKIGVRWVNGTSSTATNIYIQQVYGIL